MLPCGGENEIILDSVLRHTGWAAGGPGQGQQLDPTVLVGPSNSGHPIICRASMLVSGRDSEEVERALISPVGAEIKSFN